MKRPAVQHEPLAQRAFTLLETMLAAALGTVVVLTTLGMLAMTNVQDRRQREHVRETQELALVHDAMERSFRLLVLSEQPTPRSGVGANVARPATGEAGGAGAAGSSGDAGGDSGGSAGKTGGGSTGGTPATGQGATPAPSTPSVAPRVVLEPDGSQPISMWTLGGGMQPAQRLWVAVRAAPAFVDPDSLPPADLGGAQSTTRRRDSDADRSDATNTGAVAQEYDIAEGYRGVFELEPEPPRKVDERPTWTLWWRPVASPATAVLPRAVSAAEAASADALFGVEPDPASLWPYPLGRARLASGLVECRWEMYRERKFLGEAVATSANELPAYVKMKVQTRSGTRHEWLFEVAWSIGPEPGTATLRRGGIAGGAANGTNAQQPASGSSKPGESGSATGSGGATGPVTVRPGTGVQPGSTPPPGGSGGAGGGSGRGATPPGNITPVTPGPKPSRPTKGAQTGAGGAKQ